MAIINPSSFTVKFPSIVNMLNTECGVCKSYNPTIEKGAHPNVEKFIALWDTGATGSVITKNVVDKLGLVPTGFGKVYHANGECIVNTYLINILLPNNVGVHSLRVTEGILNGSDVLIGMDIIARGDFAISNSNGKTKFTFQIPSSHDFDFVEEEKTKIHTPIVNPKRLGRNDPCHCGSGRKFKHCHGK
jgi:thiol-disulfide isomerase/thioredoxin